MAMTLDSGSSSNDPELLVEINTTPLIDVMLVLLIMLIITIPIQLHAVNLNMPTGNPPPPPVEPEVVQIDINADGSVHWNGEVVEGISALNARFAAAAAQSVQPELHVHPDKSVAYKAVVDVMASAQRNRATKIGIVGNEQYF